MHTIQAVGDLETEIVEAQDLKRGDYVLVAEDIEDDEADRPLLVGEDYDQPRLRQFNQSWVASDGTTMLLLDDEDSDDAVPVVPTAQIRRVVEGQDHETWDLP